MLSEMLLGLLLLLVIMYLVTKKPSRIPPGLWGWPVIGHLPSTSVSLTDQVMELRPKYGDLITWRMGSRVFVFMCNYDLIKTVLSKQEFADRPDFFVYKMLKVGKGRGGIIFSNGLMWQVYRRFVLRQLRDLGMGKTRLEEAIQQEASCLVQELKKHTNQPKPLPMVCNVTLLNIIWKLVADHRFDLNDRETHSFIGLVNSITKGMQGPIGFFNIFPWLEYVTPDFLGNMVGIKDLSDNMDKLVTYMKTFVEDHQASLDPDNPKDLLDAYLKEMQKQKDDPNSVLSMEGLLNTIVDLFMAGIETTSTTMYWAILYLAKYPEVQARVQKEIDDAFSRDTQPSYQHKDKLPYFQAMIHEVHRIASIAPFAVAHSASEDTRLGEYVIPKGTVLLVHQECCHKDPKYWKKPKEFYPEHFLNEEGKFNAKRESFLPFAIGRRACVGESLARVELFVFLSAMLQNFTFTAPEGEELSTEIGSHDVIIHTPKPFSVIITERE